MQDQYGQLAKSSEKNFQRQQFEEKFLRKGGKFSESKWSHLGRPFKKVTKAKRVEEKILRKYLN